MCLRNTGRAWPSQVPNFMITAQVETLLGPKVGENHEWETNAPYRQGFSAEFIERRVMVRKEREGRCWGAGREKG